QPAVILLGWFFAYGFLVCGLHTKPIRYATPLLPVLVVFGAWACLWAGQKARDIWAIPFLGVVPLLLVALPTCVYGIAFTAIYGQEDSRIVAERWIAENIPKGSQVLAEKGGFSTAWMLPEDRYHTQFTDSSFFVFSDKWELYSAQIDFFENRIRQVDWVVLIEENRMAPFVSVPDRYPIGSAIYARLNREELGYTRTAQFKNLPWLNLSTFGPGADPTLTCFDHPTIQVYRRASDASPEALLGRWKAEVQKDPRFPDSDVLSGISAFKLQNWPESRNAFERALALDSNFVLANLLIGEIHIKNNQMDSTQAIWDRVLARDVNINKYAFMGMINAGLREEGVFYLENIARRPGEDPNLIRLAGQTHSKIAGDYQQKGDLKTALSHSLRAVDLTPEEPVPYLNAAFVCLDLGDLEQAQTLTDRAEALSPGNPMAMHAQAVLLDKKGQRDLACQILLRALSKDPKNPNHQNLLLRWGAQYQQQGRTDLAFAVFHDILMYSPDFQEARYNLGTMYLQAGDFARALPELEKAVTLKPQDPDAQFALAGVYETLGHTDRAVQHYRNALILQPDYPQAKDRLESLPVP
ncbi:MAG: tetratricopeptide repeat protein, partial [bacterium]|nr:tetratricopeptide repeat protein [bacterium]